jgi:hypothetical protein
LKFVEDTFGLGRLSATDKRATSPARNCFDFRKAPRKFVPIQSPLGIDYFKRQAPDTRLPDSE